MSEQYHNVNDLRFLNQMGKLTPDEFSAWLGPDEVVSCEEAPSPRKYRELSTLGAAVSTQCPCCIEAQVENANGAGVSRERISESVLIPAALQTAVHRMVLKFYEQWQ